MRRWCRPEYRRNVLGFAGLADGEGPTAAELAEVRACDFRWPEPGSCCAAMCGADGRAVAGSECLDCLAACRQAAGAAPGPK